MKKIIAIFSICSLMMPVFTLAQEEPVLAEVTTVSAENQDVVDIDDVDEAVVLDSANSGEEAVADDAVESIGQELGVIESDILPNSPWYWAKSFWRSLKLWATIDPVQKAAKRLEIANERLTELEAMVQAGEVPADRAEKILEKYDKEIEKLAARVEKITDKTQENVISLMNKITNQEFVRQRLMTKLQDKLQLQSMEQFKERSLEKAGRFWEGATEQGIEQQLDEIFANQHPLSARNLHNLQVLDELIDKVPENAKPAITRSRDRILNILGPSFQAMTSEQQTDKIQALIEDFGDQATTDSILNKIKAKVGDIDEVVQQAREQVQEQIQQRAEMKAERQKGRE